MNARQHNLTRSVLCFIGSCVIAGMPPTDRAVVAAVVCCVAGVIFAIAAAIVENT